MRKGKLHLEDKQFRNLRVTGKGTKPRYWQVVCDLCGRTFEARGARLQADKARCLCQRLKHGHAAGGMLTPTYQSWRAMKARCRNLKVPSHGACGIRYDQRWESFENFLADMGERPEGRTLDRKDPFGNYYRANCRWGDDLTQANNKRKTETLYYDFENNGAWGSPAEWARWLRRKTNNPLWTVRHLKAVMKTLSLDQIVGAIHPQRLSPQQLRERAVEAKRTEQQKEVDAMMAGWFEVEQAA